MSEGAPNAAARGRPPKPPEKQLGSTFTLRMTDAERERIERAAKRDGLPASDWVRRTVRVAAMGANREIPPGILRDEVARELLATVVVWRELDAMDDRCDDVHDRLWHLAAAYAATLPHRTP